MSTSAAARLATLVLLLLAGLPAALRALAARPAPAGAGAAPEGRGTPPRHWLGRATDPGPPRDLSDEERLLLGLPLDPNAAGARALAFLPGLTPRLARAVVADREANGPFPDVEALDRVEGIGPRRLALLRGRLELRTGGSDPASVR